MTRSLSFQEVYNFEECSGTNRIYQSWKISLLGSFLKSRTSLYDHVWMYAVLGLYKVLAP